MFDENNSNGWGYNIRERTLDIEYNAILPAPTPCTNIVLLDTDVNYLLHFLASSQSSREIIPSNQMVTGSVIHFYNIQSVQICNQFLGANKPYISSNIK